MPLGAAPPPAAQRELLLLRHAKSSWDDPKLADVDRPLARRGEKAARTMGETIAARGWSPDLALVSPARRARSTWEIAAEAFPSGIDLCFDARLYEADPAAILKILSGVAGRVRRVLLVGHNPGLEEFAAALAARGSDHASLDALHEKFPTGALARFVFDGGWAALRPGSARLTHFIRPRDLG